MSKQIWKPTTILNPVPVVMVSCAGNTGKPNIITLAWAGTVNTKPPMISISIKKQRFSYDLIKNSGEFVINLTTEALTRAADYCGVVSGRDVDKFEAMKLTQGKCSVIGAPLIEESPVNMECAVRQVLELGSHDLFLGEVLAVHVDDRIIDESGRLSLGKAGLICYSHGEYVKLGKVLGFFGYSVADEKVLKRRMKG